MLQTLNPMVVERLRMALHAKRSELIDSPLHPEEIAAERFADSIDDVVSANARDLAVDRINRNAQLLSQIAQALRRIEAGDYGRCLECDDPIPIGRLSALPWVALCLSCQQAEERLHGSGAYRPERWTDAA
jgi:DnaK suppressor protein